MKQNFQSIGQLNVQKCLSLCPDEFRVQDWNRAPFHLRFLIGSRQQFQFLRHLHHRIPEADYDDWELTVAEILHWIRIVFVVTIELNLRSMI